MKKNDEGFTLVELLIVIVILGILAGVVVFAVGGITNRGEENACRVGRRTLETAVEAYQADYGQYPASANNLVPGFIRETTGDFTVAGSVVTGAGDCVSF